MELNKYIDLDVYASLSKELKIYLDKLIAETKESTVIPMESYLQFPTIGNVNAIYIDKGAGKIYRWDDEDIKYYCVGADYSTIQVINCGGAS